MAPDTSFNSLHFSVQQVFAEIRIVWQLVDIWLPAPLDFGQFLLIIDDLGVERSTEYAMEQMFFVIDSRYRSRRPMIITTNLKLAELKNPPDLAHARIYDRILERCAPILFAGKNFREENAGATKQAAKDIVNSKHD